MTHGMHNVLLYTHFLKYAFHSENSVASYIGLSFKSLDF